ncbi:MAG: hypothetical protein AAFR81_28590, partial [Chloroflexota bacterium]
AKIQSTIDALDKNVAIIEFYSLQNTTIVCVLQPSWDRPKIFELPLSIDKLYYRYMVLFKDEILNRQNISDYNDITQELRPFSHSCTSKMTWGISRIYRLSPCYF